jgi:DNA-binding transcriptional ArsR family regulator
MDRLAGIADNFHLYPHSGGLCVSRLMRTECDCMKEEKVTLDREAFKTLASKTRVDILKSLDRRRKMLAELSKEFGMSPSTIKEHMDNLSRAGLVVQIDDGHKWKYYELTKKGKEIVSPTGSRIFIVLGLSLFAILITSFDMFRMYSAQVANYAALAEAPAVLKAFNEAASDAAAGGASVLLPIMPTAHLIGLVVFTVLFGIALGWILSRRYQPNLLD